MAARRRRFRWVFVVLGALAVAMVLWVVFHKKPAAPAKSVTVPVTTAKAAVEDVPVSITALGAAQAWKSDSIVAQVSGILTSVDFTEGANVRAGQLLAQVDPAPYRAALTQTQGALARDRALLAEARIDLARYRILAAQDSIARQTYDTQAALVKQDEGTVLIDEGSVAAAKVNLDRCRITSPIAGRTGVRLVDPGNLVSSGSGASSAPSTTVTGSAGSTTASASSPSSGSAASGGGGTGIVVVNQIEPIAVTFSVPQGDFQRLSDLSDGFRRPLATEALSQDTGASLGTGALSIADNRVNPATGTVELKARFANAGERLWPGQFVNVQLTLQTLSHATTIPLTAVNQGPTGAFAFVVGAGHKVSMRPIKVGWTQGATAVIASGVKPGEIVVTDGQMILKAGSVVRASAPAPAPAKQPAS
ncbi:MAG TPA: efflux RND transporter periplasmic adaptor subunit [Caulobacteraceae bacterium]|nr:efflux RND transporter periplasmic adaptor subunit [Caulobacteraceae bacterium]